jgi:hypothetical protein
MMEFCHIGRQVVPHVMEGVSMRVDIYRRSEHAGRYSYLAVPEGKQIPEEAVNVDWETAMRGVNVDDNVHTLPQYAIDKPIEQIQSKGYAITSVKTVEADYRSPSSY